MMCRIWIGRQMAAHLPVAASTTQRCGTRAICSHAVGKNPRSHAGGNHSAAHLSSEPSGVQVVWDAGSARGVLRLEGHRHFVQVTTFVISYDLLQKTRRVQDEEVHGCLHAHTQTPCCVYTGLRLGSSFAPACDAVRRPYLQVVCMLCNLSR